MDEVEATALKRTIDLSMRSYVKQHLFTATDVCEMHRTWLGAIYGWAGKYRQVNVARGGFTFAAAQQIHTLMEIFEQGPLHQHTPCDFNNKDRVIQGLAEVHVELVLIHPFREGNGRVARILATLMASQAGFPFLNFKTIEGKRREEYFSAVRAGMDKNYKPMEKIFIRVIKQTFSS